MRKRWLSYAVYPCSLELNETCNANILLSWLVPGLCVCGHVASRL